MESNPLDRDASVPLETSEGEMVTAVMITGKHPARRRLAHTAITSFLAQTYRKKELLIINTGEPLARPEPYVREICLRQGCKTLGDLRNLGIDRALGSWVIQWDDDDWHHPERIARQMTAAAVEGACVLGSQIRYSLTQKRGFICQRNAGIEGTILHRQATTHRYPSMRKAEDTAFYRSFKKQTVIMDRPELYVRFYHGNNTWDEAHLMHGSDQAPMLALPLSFLLDQVVLPYYR